MPAGNTYEAIATQTVTGSAAATVTFSSISGTYTDLVIVANAAVTTGTEDLQLQFNSDTGSNYSATQLRGNGSAASSTRVSDGTKISWMGYMESVDGGFVSLIQVQNYSNTTTNKTVLSRGNLAAGWVTATVGLWRNTAAITSITLIAGASTFKTGSTFSLYGIKSA
jgi:hypothetical protein